MAQGEIQMNVSIPKDLYRRLKAYQDERGMYLNRAVQKLLDAALARAGVK